MNRFVGSYAQAARIRMAQTTEFYFFTILKPRNQMSRSWQGCFILMSLSLVCRWSSLFFFFFFFIVSSYLLYPFVSKFSFCKDTSHTELWLTVMNYAHLKGRKGKYESNILVYYLLGDEYKNNTFLCPENFWFLFVFWGFFGFVSCYSGQRSYGYMVITSLK